MTSASLVSADIGRRVRIASIDLDVESAGWLGAVGLQLGEELVVLRRALFGGPLHVRTSAGGEFAVARELAKHIGVVPAAARTEGDAT